MDDTAVETACLDVPGCARRFHLSPQRGEGRGEGHVNACDGM
jgi:hypothetical protein